MAVANNDRETQEAADSQRACGHNNNNNNHDMQTMRTMEAPITMTAR
jgi:hypothetical protein